MKRVENAITFSFSVPLPKEKTNSEVRTNMVKQIKYSIAFFVASLSIIITISANGGRDKGKGIFDGDIPGSGYYANFDTTNVHYWAPDGIQLRDTFMLTLAYNTSCDYVHPFDGNMTSGFGKRRRRMHYGVDIDLETGDKVKCSFEGVVRFAKWNDSYGNLIIVRHPNGLETYYAHLSQIDVKPGDYVQAGQYIGLGGNTGRSFGAHLHYEVRFKGVPIDPTKLIDFTTGKLLYNNVNLFLKKDRLDLKNAERFHIVMPGEDVYSIAKLYNVEVNKLMELNQLKEDDILIVDAPIRYY